MTLGYGSCWRTPWVRRLMTGLCGLLALGLCTSATAQGAWEPVVGGGAATPNGFGSAANQAASAMAEFGGRLFVAAGGDSGAPFVVRSTTDGVVWDTVTDTGFGDADNRLVTAMALFDGQLYVGTHNSVTGCQIWRTDDGVAFDLVNTPGFGSAANAAVLALEVFGGQLYAGVQNEVAGGAIWRSANGTSWIPTVLGGFLDPANVAVASLAGYGSRFYAGTVKSSPLLNQPGELWWTDDFVTWNTAAAPGFGDSYNVGIVSLEVFDGFLFAGTAAPNFVLGNGCEIWRWDGATWILTNVPGFGTSQTTSALRLTGYLGELYVGTDNQATGARLYRYLGPLSWLTQTNDGFGDPTNIAIGSLVSFGPDLYAGTANQASGCEVWRLRGPLFTDGFESGDTSAWSGAVP